MEVILLTRIIPCSSEEQKQKKVMQYFKAVTALLLKIQVSVSHCVTGKVVPNILKDYNLCDTDDEGTVLQNVANYSPHNAALHPRRLESS
jgi:hypothetical protein